MAKQTKSGITSLPDAMKQAAAMIKSNSLPTHKQLAKDWNCSVQRVQYVLRKLKTGVGAGGKRAKEVIATKGIASVKIAPAKAVVVKRAYRRAVVKAAAPLRRIVGGQHPILAKISNTVTEANKRFGEIESHIANIPALDEKYRKDITKQAHSGVWSDLHSKLSGHLASIESLSSTRKRRRGRKKNTASKAAVKA